jgi:hypothetical protein
MQERAAHRSRMADHQTQREARAGAGAEHRRRTGPERIQQRRRIVCLLLGRCRLPPGRGEAAAVAAPVIVDDRELVGQDVGKRVKVATITRRAHDQEHRRPGAPDLVVQLGTVDGDRRHHPTP